MTLPDTIILTAILASLIITMFLFVLIFRKLHSIRGLQYEIAEILLMGAWSDHGGKLRVRIKDYKR